MAFDCCYMLNGQQRTHKQFGKYTLMNAKLVMSVIFNFKSAGSVCNQFTRLYIAQLMPLLHAIPHFSCHTHIFDNVFTMF